MELCDFLIKAKMATYAREEKITERVLEDGAKELTFESNNFTYRDRYYGFNPFVGEEIVWRDNKLIWSMNYFGKVFSDNISVKEVYKFLRIAMRQVKKDRPFRGPNNFKSGYFEYINKSTGNIHNFIGTERIFYKGKEIYKLNYHRGLM